MKKTWTTPELSSLEITETAGGTTYNEQVDGAYWQDDEGNWHRPLGYGEDS